jgi:hypothetical protein
VEFLRWKRCFWLALGWPSRTFRRIIMDVWQTYKLYGRELRVVDVLRKEERIFEVDGGGEGTGFWWGYEWRLRR